MTRDLLFLRVIRRRGKGSSSGCIDKDIYGQLALGLGSHVRLDRLDAGGRSYGPRR